ncbi:MAG TPA: isocitrate/isopropylmalate dehydrogenase family protein [Dehalococcoidia bacterium]|nr:isocitrate/isopropylmalate dehydrogenase family protein [Dehalococcoidia bacterium]
MGSRRMGHYRLGVLYGDGIGPEIVASAVEVLEAATMAAGGLSFDLVRLPIGWEAIQQRGVATPPETFEALAACDGWIMGPHDNASYPPEERAKLNPSGALRHHFDLYANIRPARTYLGVPSLLQDVDLIVARENTEGFYADRNMVRGTGEFMPTEDLALVVGRFTRRAAERIARTGFELASGRKKHVTIVHKANVLQMAYGMFREVCQGVGAEYPDVRVDDYHIDAMAAHLVRRAADFDVIVTTNMFGDILSDLAGELVGSLGLLGSINAGQDRAMAQATHGSAPDIAGRGIANPISEVVSTALLLRWIGRRHSDPAADHAAAAMERAVELTLSDGIRTPDLGGEATTKDLTAALVTRTLEPRP